MTMTNPANYPFAVDWFDGLNWHSEVYSISLDEALVVAAREMRKAIKQYPDDFHIMRVHGPGAYITLDSNQENEW